MASKTKQILQDSVPPVASFYATPLAGACPLRVEFHDTSVGDIKYWRWDFGKPDTTVGHVHCPEPVVNLSSWIAYVDGFQKTTFSYGADWFSAESDGLSGTVGNGNDIFVYFYPPRPTYARYLDCNIVGSGGTVYTSISGSGGEYEVSYETNGHVQLDFGANCQLGSIYCSSQGLMPNVASVDVTDISLTIDDNDYITYTNYDGEQLHSQLQHPTHVYTQAGVYSITLTVIDKFGVSDSITKYQYINVTGGSFGTASISINMETFLRYGDYGTGYLIPMNRIVIGDQVRLAVDLSVPYNGMLDVAVFANRNHSPTVIHDGKCLAYRHIPFVNGIGYLYMDPLYDGVGYYKAWIENVALPAAVTYTDRYDLRHPSGQAVSMAHNMDGTLSQGIASVSSAQEVTFTSLRGPTHFDPSYIEREWNISADDIIGVYWNGWVVPRWCYQIGWTDHPSYDWTSDIEDGLRMELYINGSMISSVSAGDNLEYNPPGNYWFTRITKYIDMDVPADSILKIWYGDDGYPGLSDTIDRVYYNGRGYVTFKYDTTPWI